MLNVLRKPTESDNLATGISSMNFLGGAPKVSPLPRQQQDVAPTNFVPQQNIVVAAPPEPPAGDLSAAAQPARSMPSVLPRSNMYGSTIQDKAKGWSLSTTPLFGAVRGQPTNNLHGEMSAPYNPPRVPAGGSPLVMNEQSPLAMPDNILFGSAGNNVAKAARGWSPFNTPVFQAVQNQPIARRSRITNKIGRVANRNNGIGATRLRLF